MNAYTHNTLRIPYTFAGCSENENRSLCLTYMFYLGNWQTVYSCLYSKFNYSFPYRYVT